MTFFQAIIIGVLQGVTELFPISSLGHSVLLPSLFGWNNLVAAQADHESYFLAFLVGLHVATALALLIFYRREWIQIIKGFFGSIAKRRIETSTERLAWLIIIATIPVGIIGVLFEKSLRMVFTKPMAAALLLIVNGLILWYGDWLMRSKHQPPTDYTFGATFQHLQQLSFGSAFYIGASQIAALFAGISRSGITMVGGLMRGLDHEDAARFSFLLATPVILAAGLLKLPDLFGPLGDGVRAQIWVGSLAAGIAAYASVKFLDHYFRSNKLKPFAIYCILFGAFMLLKLR